jgi:hypothetical protein
MSKEFQEFEIDLRRPVTITAREVANILHRHMYRGGREHHMVHSCPCDHLALFYLGLRPTTGLYWPTKEGDNGWERKNEKALEIMAVGRAILAERERVVSEIRKLPNYVAINTALEAVVPKTVVKEPMNNTTKEGDENDARRKS